MRSLSPPILILGLSWIGMASGSPQEAQHEISSEPVNQDDSYEAMPGPELSPELWLRTTSAMESRSSSIAKAAAQLKKVTAEIESSGRLSHMTRLTTSAIDLEREIVRANLAAENIDKP